MAKSETPKKSQEQPQAGGRYFRDPDTGTLKRQAHTKPRPAKQKNKQAKEGAE
jgi:hypothetical protein